MDIATLRHAIGQRDGFVVTACGMRSERGSPRMDGIRNMEFQTLNKTLSVLITTMCISTIFQKLDYRDHGYVTPGADKH